MAAGAAADTWHLPPQVLAAAPAATGAGGSPCLTGFFVRVQAATERAGMVRTGATQRDGSYCCACAATHQMSPAATAKGGSLYR